MSEINITVGNSMAGTTIDTEQMRQRLENIRTQLETALSNGVGNPDELNSRIAKVDSQIERLDNYDGQNVNVSAGYATRELERGMRQITDGMNFVQRNGSELDNPDALEKRLAGWHANLFDKHGRLNTYG